MPDPVVPLKPDEKVKINITPKDKPKLDSMGRPIEGRGRPKGFKKPAKLTWADFEKDALSKACDDLIKDFINATVLGKHTGKLKDTKVGSAMLYAIYYYTDFKPDHPVMVLLFMGLVTANNIKTCLKSPKIVEEKKKPEEKTERPAGTTKE